MFKISIAFGQFAPLLADQTRQCGIHQTTIRIPWDKYSTVVMASSYLYNCVLAS